MASTDRTAVGGDVTCGVWDPAELPVEVLLDLVPHWVGHRDWFEWKHLQSPFGPALIHLAWVPGADMPIGVVALGCTRTTASSGGTVPTAFIYETFTLPQFRGRGVLTQLLRHVEQTAAADGVAAVFALPNPMAQPGYQRANYTPVLPVRGWVRPTARAMADLRRLRQLVSSQQFRSDLPQSASTAGLSNAVPLPTIHTDRDESVWRWRIGGQPVSSYDVLRLPAGWAVIRTGRRGTLREIQILSLLRDPGRRTPLRELLKAAYRSVKERADLVSFLSMGHDQSRHLVSAGFAPVRVVNTVHLRSFTTHAAEQLDAPWAFDGLDIHTW
jgi:GNAT superfamily N-acetyltransferase